MNDIITKLLLKWFNWKLDSVRDEIKKLNIKKQKELQEEFEDVVKSKINDLIIAMQEEIEWTWETILNDIDDAKEEDINKWSSDEK